MNERDDSGEQETLWFGTARRRITPTVPVSLSGYFNVRMWDAVLDDIWAQALLLRQGRRMTAIVQLDLLYATAELCRAVRDSIRDISGLDPRTLVLAASHTHTAPETRLSHKGSNQAYNAFLVRAVADAIREAAATLRPGTFLHGRAKDDRFAFNRRCWMTSGRVVTNPPRRDPGIVRPEGPIDPEIGLLGIRSDGKLAVLLVNISNHADTIGGNGVSGDWPGFLRRRLEDQLGAVILPLIGASGNINHFDLSKDINQTRYPEAQRIGEGYAETVIAAVANMVVSNSQNLRTAHTVFRTGPREIPPEDIALAQEHSRRYEFIADHDLTAEDLAKNSPAVLKYFADELLKVAADRAERRYETVAMLLGETVLVSLPGEPFVEIGLRIKQEMTGGRPTLVVAHANGAAGYIPNRFNFGRGGYETTPASAPNSVETADRMLEAVQMLLRRLLRQ